jgi:multidrug efflux system membrane fusion protein
VINQIQPVNVYFSVTQAELPLVQRYFAGGEPLRVEAVLPEDSQTQVGQLFFIDNTIDKATGMVLVGASFANTQEHLWPGQHVQVVLRLAQRSGVVMAPSRAVQPGREGTYVYVVGADQTAQVRSVTVGQAFGDDVVIEQGLSSGEMVVTDGQFRLSPGAKLTLKPASSAPSTGAGPAAVSSPASQVAPATSSGPARRQGGTASSAPAEGTRA